MVRQLPTEVRRRVAELWLDGNTYRDISRETGVSVGAIASIIEEERRRVPDIEELRALRQSLKRTDTAVADAQRGARFLEKLDSLNIHIDRLPAYVNLLDQYGQKAGEILELGQRLRNLEASCGKTYNEIVADAAEKTNRLQEMTIRIGDLKREEETIKKSLQDISQLKALSEKMGHHSLSLHRLDSFIEHHIKLEELGFSPKATELLASELSNQGLDPQKAASKLASLLSQHQELAMTVAQLEREKIKVQADIKSKKDQQEALARQLETLRQQVNSFESLIQNEENIHRNKIAQLAEQHALKQKELEAQIQNLETKRKAVAKEIEMLKDEGEAVQARLGEAQAALQNIEEMTEKARPLATLAALMEDPRFPLDPAILLRVSASFIDGLRAHIEANPKFVSSSLELRRKLEEISKSLGMELHLAARKAQ